MDISQRSRGSWTNEDQRWIGGGGRQGMPNRSVILERDLFPNLGRYANGFVPSGEPLGVVTATGKYGPHDAAAVDGRAVLRGHLFATVPIDRTATGDIGGALFWDGEVITNYLPAVPPAGANGRADVAGHISYVTHVI